MPPISATEQIALGAGTIGFDRDIFTGSPSLAKLIDTYKIDEERGTYLTEEEVNFMNDEVPKLCKMLCDYEVIEGKDFPKEAWDYMRKGGFFSLKIPKVSEGIPFDTIIRYDHPI